jgi:pimeloyl-ACP methyl ester carboxylesterase
VPPPSFACETAAHRTIDVNGLALHALEWAGPAPGLLFLHGGSAHAHWFDHVIPPLIGRFHIVSLDQRGHGESTWPSPPSYRTQDFASDIDGVRAALGWEAFISIGHSMGGHNTLAYAAWYPDRLLRFVIVDSRPSIPKERLAILRQRGHRALRPHPSAAAAIGTFRLVPRETVADPALLGHLARVGIVERDGGWVYRFDPSSNHRREPVETWDLLSLVRAPALVLRAEHSPVLPPPLAEKLCAGLPSAELVEIPGAYHHVTLDAPKAVVAALEPFLAKGSAR